MDHPLCKICQPPRRHPLGGMHVFPAAPVVLEEDPPRPKKIASAPPRDIEDGQQGSVLNRALMASVKKVGVMVPVDEVGRPVCPVCEARREKNRQRVQKHRAKRA